MDMSAHNVRKKAEDGIFLALKDPFTGVPLGEGDTAPGFVIRGTAAPSVQARLAEMQKKAKDTPGSDNEKAMVEAMHSELIDSALRFIISAKNMEIEGKAVTSDADIRALLDMTFPEMRVAKNAEGNPIQVSVKGEDGKDVMIPQLEIANNPFAKQVVDAAGESARFLGKTLNA